MDWNLKRRRQERAIAQEIAQQFLLEIEPNTAAAPPNELLAHHIGLVYQRLNIEPNECQMGRVLEYVSKEIARGRRSIDCRQSGG